MSEEPKRYFWMKLQHDFFSSKRMKKLRRLSADYMIIYLKMQLLSIKNNGYLTFDGVENSFEEELATDLDENVDQVRLTIAFLMQYKLMETSDNIRYFLPYAAENTGSETASARRVRDYRERQKALHCNTDVTEVKRLCNVEIEIEKDKKKYIKKKNQFDNFDQREYDFEAVENLINQGG